MMTPINQTDWQKLPKPQDHSARSVNAQNEDDLLRLLQAGEEAAWGVFVQEYGARLFTYLMPHLPDLEAVEDVVSETLLAAVKEIKKYQGHASLLTLVFALANRKLSDFWRKAQRQKTAEAAQQTDARSSDDFTQFAQPVDDFLSKVTEADRKILLLRYSEGFSYPEIAKTLNIPVKAAEIHLNQARQRLRVVLADPDPPLPTVQKMPDEIHNVNSALHMLEVQTARSVARGMEDEVKLFIEHANVLREMVVESR